MEKQFIDSVMPIVAKHLFEDLNASISNQDCELSKRELQYKLSLLFKNDEEMKLAHIKRLFRKVFSFIKYNINIGIADTANKGK